MARRLQQSLIRKHSIEIGGVDTSISLEPTFWYELTGIARRNGRTIGQQLAIIGKGQKNRASAVRLAVLALYKR